MTLVAERSVQAVDLAVDIRTPIAAPQPQPSVPDAATLAVAARQFEQRVWGLVDDLDPSWLAQPQAAAWTSLRPALASPRVRAELFTRLCGPLPPLHSLTEPAAALAGIRSRDRLVAWLAAFALLGRLGAVRCCVHRPTREALSQCLGPAWAPLRELSRGSTAVGAELAERSPLDWAWMGYDELCARRAWPHRSLRRLARLALPVGAGRVRAPRSRWPVGERLQALDSLFEGRLPC